MATQNETRLQAYLDAEAKILAGQSVRMGDRELRRADLAQIRDEISKLQRTVASEQAAAAGRSRFALADLGGEW